MTETAAALRERAGRLRTLARNLNDARAKTVVLDMAAELEQQAAALEGPRPSPPNPA
jgi:hypothetical protein